MSLLCEEYSHECRQSKRIPYKYSQFIYYFDQYLQHTGFKDAIHHKPNEEIDVDWGGIQPRWLDPDTG